MTDTIQDFSEEWEQKYLNEIIEDTGFNPTKYQVDILKNMDELTRHEILLSMRNGITKHGNYPLPQLLQDYGASEEFIKTAQSDLARWYWSNIDIISKEANKLTDFEMDKVFNFAQSKLSELGLSDLEVEDVFKKNDFFRTNRVFTDPELRQSFDEFLRDKGLPSIFSIEDKLDKAPDEFNIKDVDPEGKGDWYKFRAGDFKNNPDMLMDAMMNNKFKEIVIKLEPDVAKSFEDKFDFIIASEEANNFDPKDPYQVLDSQDLPDRQGVDQEIYNREIKNLEETKFNEIIQNNFSDEIDNYEKSNNISTDAQRIENTARQIGIDTDSAKALAKRYGTKLLGGLSAIRFFELAEEAVEATVGQIIKRTPLNNTKAGQALLNNGIGKTWITAEIYNLILWGMHGGEMSMTKPKMAQTMLIGNAVGLVGEEEVKAAYAEADADIAEDFAEAFNPGKTSLYENLDLAFEEKFGKRQMPFFWGKFREFAIDPQLEQYNNFDWIANLAKGFRK